jgi:uncharacterized protein YeaO (DUF488 family)
LRLDLPEGRMPIHVVRLGSPRLPGDGLRIGTVRRPPRGVPKADFAKSDFYDVWLPELAPSEELLKAGQEAVHRDDAARWKAFDRKYRAEMKRPEKAHVLDLLAALSRNSSFSVGCYCASEDRCHRSILRELLLARGARVA